MTELHVAVVSLRPVTAKARLTVASAAAVVPDAHIHVLDVDGAYAGSGSLGAEHVMTPDDVGIPAAQLHHMGVVLDPHDLERALYPALLRSVSSGAARRGTMLAVRPGVVLLGPPTALVDAARARGLCVLARTPGPLPDDGLWPAEADLARDGAHAPGILGLDGARTGLLDLWEASGTGPDGVGERWLDVAASLVPHHTVRDVATLVTAWNLGAAHDIRPDGGHGLTVDGHEVLALDLTALDPERPWLLDATVPRDPRGRLSDHPALAAAVARWAAQLVADMRSVRDGPWDPTMTSIGTPVDEPLRALYRTAAASDDERPPDPFDRHSADALVDWLTAPTSDGGPGRYLRAVHSTRPDLGEAFPQVPGADTDGFLAWARTHGSAEYPAALIDRALSRTVPTRPSQRPRPTAGVNVVGYLRGELGIGESARLMVAALRAAGVPCATVPVDRHLTSRQNAAHDATPGGQLFDTTLICVNADLTPSVAGSVQNVLGHGYRIGMWYWEVEDFPVDQHGGFAHVDEVWVATDFVRGAIEPHSPVPVRTVTPPLPQRGAPPTLTRADLGLPDRPVFLFSFDYLSTAERKNPIGLVDAFTSAFAPGEGPVLVVKSINAGRRPAEAEHLRLRAAAEPDVLLLEDYLDADARDALVALCDCYVSLHRSEGLGLTMAEAMAWGKPVIATAYSGNLQFMTEENSFLVPWAPVAIPAGAEPYPAGGVWADPDLEAAARMMRTVVDAPEVAAQRGGRAAADIASLHSPEAAGRLVVARLAETAPRRRAKARRALATRVAGSARRAARGTSG